MQVFEQATRGSRLSEATRVFLAAMERAVPAFRDRSILLTTLAVIGVASGLVIATLLSRDPREAGAYAVACLMIGGSIALGLRGRETGMRMVSGSHSVDSLAPIDPLAADPLAAAEDQMRAAAHDLKAPLLTVTSYLELIADGAFGAVSEDVRDALTRAAAVSTQAQTVVDSALGRDAIAAAKRSWTPPVLHRVDLNQVVSDVIGALNCSMRERQANVAIEGRLPFILGEDAAVFRVLENILQNAIKFCPRDTTPHIAVRSAHLNAGLVELTITDNGPGLGGDATQFLDRGVRGVNTGVPGHGIGLATVLRLMTRMGGRVRFESPAEGGTTVRLILRSE